MATSSSSIVSHELNAEEIENSQAFPPIELRTAGYKVLTEEEARREITIANNWNEEGRDHLPLTREVLSDTLDTLIDLRNRDRSEMRETEDGDRNHVQWECRILECDSFSRHISESSADVNATALEFLSHLATARHIDRMRFVGYRDLLYFGGSLVYDYENGMLFPEERALSRVVQYTMDTPSAESALYNTGSRFGRTLWRSVHVSCDRDLQEEGAVPRICVYSITDFISTVYAAMVELFEADYEDEEEKGRFFQDAKFHWLSFASLFGDREKEVSNDLGLVIVDLQKAFMYDGEMRQFIVEVYVAIVYLYAIADEIARSSVQDHVDFQATLRNALKYNKALFLIKESGITMELFFHTNYKGNLNREQREMFYEEIRAVFENDEYGGMQVSDALPIPATAAPGMPNYEALSVEVTVCGVRVRPGCARLPATSQAVILWSGADRRSNLCFMAKRVGNTTDINISKSIAPTASPNPLVQIDENELTFDNNGQARGREVAEEVMRAFLSGACGPKRAWWMITRLACGEIRISQRSEAAYARFFGTLADEEAPAVNTPLAKDIRKRLPVLVDEQEQKAYLVLGKNIDPIRVQAEDGRLMLLEQNADVPGRCRVGTLADDLEF
ncbi:unnamed protein product [Agarophyton chilense]|eukprot:gb/GEZJ01002598.1/.p1 GENE.gb/GEZJ01002598.1/~~gb/GEZJ01002598.1/.p1  ORF type:complete len:618 (-),score=94.72 gb/GEZJ01002598.1/:419-2272(-)